MRWRCAHRTAENHEAPLAFVEVEAPTSELALEQAVARLPRNHEVVTIDPLR